MSKQSFRHFQLLRRVSLERIYEVNLTSAKMKTMKKQYKINKSTLLVLTNDDVFPRYCDIIHLNFPAKKNNPEVF